MGEYDFILNNDPGRHYNVPQSGGGGVAKRAIVVLGGLIGLTLLIVIVFGVILKPSAGPVDRIAAITALQADIIDFSDEADRELRTTEALALATGAQLVLETDRRNLESVARPPSESEVAAATDSAIRATLESSKSNNRYDETYQEIMTSKLAIYRDQLRSVFDESDSSQQQALQLAFDNAEILAE